MNTYFLIAGILCILLGVVHSALGEYLIFRNKRKKGSFIPNKGSAELKERHLRIIWATWHLSSVFGWCIGVIILKFSCQQNQLHPNILNFIMQSITYSMFLTSLLVLIGTKGKHPGWIVLLVIGILLLIGN